MLSKIIVLILTTAMLLSVGHTLQAQTQSTTNNLEIQKSEKTYLFATIDIVSKPNNNGDELYFYHYDIIIKDFLQLKFDEEYACECQSKNFLYYVQVLPQTWNEKTKIVSKYRLGFYQVKKGKTIDTRTGLVFYVGSSQENQGEQGSMLAMEPECYTVSIYLVDDNTLTLILNKPQLDRIVIKCVKEKRF